MEVFISLATGLLIIIPGAFIVHLNQTSKLLTLLKVHLSSDLVTKQRSVSLLSCLYKGRKNEDGIGTPLSFFLFIMDFVKLDAFLLEKSFSDCLLNDF